MGLLGNFDFLPEDQQKREAARAGLLQFGASMLGGTGNFGQILGNGITAGAQGYHGTLAQQQQKALRDLQAKQLGLENQKLQAGIDEPMELAKIAAGAGGGPRPLGAPAAAGGIAPISSLPQVGQAKAAPAPAAAEAKPVDQYQYYLGLSQAYSSAGKMTAAKTAMEMADKLKPKLKEQQARTVDGKRVLANVYDDGRTEQVQGFAPDLEKLHFADRGATIDGLDQFNGAVISTAKKAAGPEAVMRDATDRRGQNMVDARAKATAAAAAAAAGNAEGLLDDETVKIMAEQYLAGDTSVMQNLGRGAQGAKNIIKIRKEITNQTKAEGKGGRDLAAQNAEYFGTKAGQRSAGTRIANVEMASYEAESLIPLAEQASAEVARSGLLPFGKAQVMFNEQTNDPKMRQFAAANNALVNVYARAISPSGTPTVADKEHAREMIATAMDHKSYMAVTGQMRKEITAARAAPKQVRKAFNEAVTGKGDHGVKDLPQKPAATAYTDAEKERRYQEWKRSQAK